jgi:hypothetical protein
MRARAPVNVLWMISFRVGLWSHSASLQFDCKETIFSWFDIACIEFEAHGHAHANFIPPTRNHAIFGSIHRLCHSNYDLSTPTLIRDIYDIYIYMCVCVYIYIYIYIYIGSARSQQASRPQRTAGWSRREHQASVLWTRDQLPVGTQAVQEKELRVMWVLTLF